ncbi:MAG: HD domain-containing protein [Candidatus Krumholzibacteriota bacterium]|nr:HD domain-containing protein [Candidatus Krumholzibacteriota bacterium]
MDRQPVNSLRPGGQVESVYILKRKLLKKNPDGSRFLLFQFSDNSGVVGGILWEDAQTVYDRLTQGRFVVVRGEVQEYREMLQVRVQDVRQVDGGQFDLADFLPVTPLDREILVTEWRQRLGEIRDAGLRALLTDMLEDDDLGWRFQAAPAGKTWHHAYVGGLLEHVVRLTRIVATVCDLYPDLDRDLMMAACYLHDIGKVRELEYERSIDYGTEGKLLGHVVLGVEILDEFLPRHPELAPETIWRLKHLIVSHQGSYEFGSPMLPKTVEAIVFHHIDNIDAQFDGFTRVLKEGRDTMGADSDWTGVNKLLGRNLYMGEPEA